MADNGTNNRPGSKPPKGRGRKPSKPNNSLFAALDLGTNSCRMFIAKPNGQEFQIVDAFSRSVHLGHGLEEHGSLSRAAIGRTMSALKICEQKLRRHGVRKTRLVATEACRRARNGKSFVRRVLDETGLKLEIIDPSEEAKLAVIGCAPYIAQDTNRLLVVDIGGGSTELVWIDFTGCPAHDRSQAVLNLEFGCPEESLAKNCPSAFVIDWVSVPLGVATLKSQFSDVNDDGARFALMSCCFEEKLDELETSICAEQAGKFQIIGTSGTVTTVAASHLGLKRYDRHQVNGMSLTKSEIDRVICSYVKMGPEGRAADGGIGRDRQELIMSGVAILQAILRIWPTEQFTVADCGLREGLLYSQMDAAGLLKQDQTGK